MPSHSNFLERGRLEEHSHLLQRLDTIRLDLMTPDIEEQSFSNENGEMIAGPLHPDVTIVQFRPKHLLKILLHLPQALFSCICAPYR